MKRVLTIACLITIALLMYQCEKSRPNMAFSVSSFEVEVGEEVTFTNETTGATSYKWYFGDGEISTEHSPTHAYQAEGTYFVTLAAFNGNQKGVAYATITVGETDETVAFRMIFTNAIHTTIFVTINESSIPIA